VNEQVTVDSVSMQQELRLRLTGDLTRDNADRVAAEVSAAMDGLRPRGLVLVDLRQLTALSATGARTLLDLAAAAGTHALHLRLVVDPAGVVAQALDVADPGHVVPRFAEPEDAAVPEAAHDLPAGEDNGTDPLLKQVEALTRALLDADTVAAALQQVIVATTVTVPGADLVSVTLRAPDGRFLTPVQTAPAAAELTQVQYRTGEGPCLDAARPDAPGYAQSSDLRSESRWPRFAAVAGRHGFRAVLSTALFLDGSAPESSGALNIYSRRPRAFTPSDRTTALLLATHASLALVHTRAAELADLHEHQLRRAIDTRDVIGQAKGILMNRQHITADEAFALLRRTSQDLNVKLVDIARTLTHRHGELDPAGQEDTPP
jgi:anti-anti-sigma regulatory factor